MQKNSGVDDIPADELSEHDYLLTDEQKREYSNTIDQTCTKLSSKDVDGGTKVKCLDELAHLGDEVGDQLFAIYDLEKLVRCLRPYFVHRSKYMRAAVVRCCRHLTADPRFTLSLWKYHCHFFISKMLEKDKKGEKERKQAFEFVKALIRSANPFCDIEAQRMPLLLVKSLVSVAETPDDPLRLPCMELVRDLVLKNAKVVANSNGIKLIINAILEPEFKEISESLTLTILYLLDDKAMRQYIRPQHDLQCIAGVFTEGTLKDIAEFQPKWEASRRAISTMMKTWTGLICLSTGVVGVKPMVDALRVSGPPVRRRIIFDTIIDVLRAASPAKYHEMLPPLSDGTQQDSAGNSSSLSGGMTAGLGGQATGIGVSGTGLSALGSAGGSSESIVPESPSSKNASQQPSIYSAINSNTSVNAFFLPNIPQGDNIMKTYLAVVLVSFIYHGLVDALVELSKDLKDLETSRRATQLLHVMLVFSDNLLASSRCLKMHDGFDLNLAMELNPQLPAFLCNRTNDVASMLTLMYRHTLSHNKRKLIQMDGVKTKLDTAMDDAQFSALLRDTQVLVTKDYKRWNWEFVTTLLYGPLRIPSRLQDALKTKLCKRIVSFYKPRKKMFSDLPYKEEFMKFAAIGCQLIEVLLATEQGSHFLSTSGFLDELYSSLQVELKANAAQNPNRIFTPEKMAYTMSREFFTLIGKFSSYANGVKLLVESKIFETVYELTNLRVQRDDLCQLIIKHMDYSHSNHEVGYHTRRLLKEAMTSGSKKIRYFCTLRLRNLLRQGIADFQEWGISLLHGQLTDGWSEIVKSTLRILAEACSADPEYLSAFINLKPNIALLENEHGKNLLLKLLSRPEGFRYLNAQGWIQKTLQQWKTTENLEYVVSVEQSLHQVMTSRVERKSSLSFSIVSEEGVCIPPHFYGELCQTVEGCALLEASGHFHEFMAVISDKKANKLQRRAALWAVGQIGSSDTGFAFLEKDNFLQRLVDLAESATCLSLRGTCIYIIGLTAKAPRARAQLHKLGWETFQDLVTLVSVAVPRNPVKLLTVPTYKYKGSIARGRDRYTLRDKEIQFNLLTTPSATNPSEPQSTPAKILQQLALLANPVTQEAASKTLKRMRISNMEDFCSPQLMFHVYILLTQCKYRLQARRFIHELFEGTAYGPLDFEFLDNTFMVASIDISANYNNGSPSDNDNNGSNSNSNNNGSASMSNDGDLSITMPSPQQQQQQQLLDDDDDEDYVDDDIPLVPNLQIDSLFSTAELLNSSNNNPRTSNSNSNNSYNASTTSNSNTSVAVTSNQ